MKHDFVLQHHGQLGFQVAAKMLMRPCPDRLPLLRGLSPQELVVARQNYLHEVLIIEASAECAVEKLDDIVHFEFWELSPTSFIFAHKLHNFTRWHSTRIVPVDPREARIRLENINHSKLLPLEFDPLLFLGDEQQQLAEFGFQSAAEFFEIYAISWTTHVLGCLLDDSGLSSMLRYSLCALSLPFNCLPWRWFCHIISCRFGPVHWLPRRFERRWISWFWNDTGCEFKPCACLQPTLQLRREEQFSVVKGRRRRIWRFGCTLIRIHISLLCKA